MAVLRDLLELQCTTTDLEKVPDLVATVRKVTHFALERVLCHTTHWYCQFPTPSHIPTVEALPCQPESD